MRNYLKILFIDEYSITPKYIQLVNGIIAGINSGQIEKGDMLPSINDLSYALDISRNTIERVYNELKKLGIVGSVPGKGVFILNTDFKRPLKILLLFNKLSSHKKIIYDSFVKAVGDNAAVDFYIYNNDFYLFKRILTEKLNSDYNKFVIVPYFIDNDQEAQALINTIPKEKLVIMDKLVDGLTGQYSAVYEDFEQDIYGALSTLLDSLSKYNTIKIIFPKSTYYSKGIVKGFKDFCADYAFDYEVLTHLNDENIQPGVVYINLVEDDLVLLVKKIIDSSLVIGKDVGLISYNETSIKQVILNGITTISTNFEALGEKTAEVVLNNDNTHYNVPFTVTLRNSL
ncbi:MAG: GntR family transcriptional regulator [Sphingobacteriaceae bacterium]|nr:MAG: GntR family transcriptional regulator [Sphingobacteriaceae bacterium]